MHRLLYSVFDVELRPTAAEEIGFYRGHSYEKNVVERSYFGLVKHINRVLKVRIWHGVVEEGIVKWVRSRISFSDPGTSKLMRHFTQLWGSFGVC